MGTLQANLGVYTDTYGQIHSFDTEIPDVQYAPQCPYNLMSVDLLRKEKIYLDSRFHTGCILCLRVMHTDCEHDYGEWKLVQQLDQHTAEGVFVIQYGFGNQLFVSRK